MRGPEENRARKKIELAKRDLRTSDVSLRQELCEWVLDAAAPV